MNTQNQTHNKFKSQTKNIPNTRLTKSQVHQLTLNIYNPQNTNAQLRLTLTKSLSQNNQFRRRVMELEAAIVQYQHLMQQYQADYTKNVIRLWKQAQDINQKDNDVFDSISIPPKRKIMRSCVF